MIENMITIDWWWCSFSLLLKIVDVVSFMLAVDTDVAVSFEVKYDNVYY